MALSRVQLIAGASNTGTPVLAGEVQGVIAGSGITIDTVTGTISVNGSDPSFNGFVKTNSGTAYNNYVWPDVDGAAGEFLRTDGAGALDWASPTEGPVVYVNSAPPPGTPVDGQMWFNCSDGTLNVYQSCLAPAGWTNTAQSGLPVSPGDTVAVPDFDSGTGTLADPYQCTVTTTAPGGSVFVINEVTIDQLAPFQYVPIVDLDAATNGGRFSFTNNYADGSGVLVFQTVFRDSPASGSGVSYTARIKVGYGSVYIDAVVNVAGPLALVSPGSIAGTPTEGAQLTYTPGTTSGGLPPIVPSWLWKNNLNATLATGGTTYTIPVGQAGKTIYVAFSASDSQIPAETVSGNTVSVGPVTAFTLDSPGSISGIASEGQTLTYTQGTVSNGVPTYNYSWEWKNNLGTVLQSDGTTFEIPSSEVGREISVELTVTDSASTPNTVTGTTATVGPVTAFVLTDPGTISGTAQVGATLTYNTGTATGGVPPYSFGRVWKDSSNNTLATDVDTYVVQAAEAGKTIRVEVTASDSATPANTDSGVTPATATVAFSPIPSGDYAPAPSDGLDTLPGGNSATWDGPSGTLTASGCLEISTDGISYGSSKTVTSGVTTLYQRWINSGPCMQAVTGTVLNGILSDGTHENVYNVTIDRKPASFTFNSVGPVPLGSTQASNDITISDINTTAYVTAGAASTGTTIQGSLDAGGNWTNIPASGTGFAVNNSDTLRVRLTTGSTGGASYTAVINIGDGDNNVNTSTSSTFTVTNTSDVTFPSTTFTPSAGPNASPDFTALVSPSLYGTASATWGAGSLTISTTGDLQYKIGAGSWESSTGQAVIDGNTVSLRWNPTAVDAAETLDTLSGDLVGGPYTNTYSMTVDKQPATYAWNNLGSEGTSSVVTSDPITVSGFNAPIELTYTAPGSNALTSVLASINGGSFTAIPTSSPGLVVNPSKSNGTDATTIQIRATTGGDGGVAYTLTTNLGFGTTVVSDEWSVTTTNTPNALNTPSITGPSGSSLNPAANSPNGLTVIGSAYSVASGSPGAHVSSDWQVFGNTGTFNGNPETSAITVVTQNSGTSWTSQTSGTANQIHGLAYGNNLYALVGDSGTIRTSSNGSSWSGQIDPTGGSSFRGLAYLNNSLFVGGINGSANVLTSSNGTTWIVRSVTSGASDGYRGFAYGLGTYVAVGYSGVGQGKIATSTDGTTWADLGNTLGGNTPLYGAAFGNGLFVAVGENGVARRSSDPQNTWTSVSTGAVDTLYGITYAAGLFVAVGGSFGVAKIVTSPDGVNWNVRTSPVAQQLRAVSFYGGVFTAVGSNGTVITSTDGITWASSTSGTTDLLLAVTGGGSLFVTGGNNGTLLTSASPAGSTTLTLTDSTDLASFAVGDSVVEVGGGSNASGTVIGKNAGSSPFTLTVTPSSTDWTTTATVRDTSRTITKTNQPLTSTSTISGTSSGAAAWTTRSSGISEEVNGTAYENGKWLALATSGAVYTSTDGASWSRYTQGGAPSWKRPIYGNGVWVGPGNGGGLGSGSVNTSPSGNQNTWTNQSTGGVSINPQSSLYAGGKLLIVGEGSGPSGRSAVSTNGTTWNAGPTVGSTKFTGVTYDGTRYLAITDGANAGGAVYTSTDGLNWSFLSTASGGIDILYNQGLYVAVGASGQIRTSTDATNWTSRTSGIANNLVSVAYGNGTYVAVASGGSIVSSTDGITWSTMTSGTTENLRAVNFVNGIFVATGDNGTILTSLGRSTSTLTISGANTDGFTVGTPVSNGITGASSAYGTISSINGSSVVVFPSSANWTNGQNLYRGETIVNVTADTTNKTSYFIPMSSLDPSTTYFARVRYNAASVSSAFSAYGTFGTGSTFSLTPGQQIFGGYYAGQIKVFAGQDDGTLPLVDTVYNIIVAPKTEGSLNGQISFVQWKTGDSGPDALANNAVYGKPATASLAGVSFPLFNWCINTPSGPNAGATSGGTGIGGFNDWYIPAKNELEVCYYFLKPDTQTNQTPNGSNPNAVAPEPVSTSYTSGNPAQTSVTLFRDGNAQAFNTIQYWSATEDSSLSDRALYQLFGNGSQANSFKTTSSYYGRAIRRVLAYTL